MKKVLLLVLAVVLVSALIILSGCESKPAGGSDSNSIVGSWTYPGTSYTYKFNADGTGEYVGSPFTYELSGDKISILYEGGTVPFESTYKIEGNKLNIIDSLGNDTLYNRD